MESQTFHFLMLAPGLQAEWLFGAAQRYWQRFHPIVIDDVELAGFVYGVHHVVFTVLARPDTAVYVQNQIQGRYPDARIDLIIKEEPEAMQQELNARAESGKAFG